METRLDITDRDPVLTAVVGDNSDLIKKVSDLYIPDDAYVLDMTYGQGVFWRQVDTSRFNLVANDINPDLGEITHDFRNAPWEEGVFDVVVFDPPYMYRSSGSLIEEIDRRYGNNARETYGVEAVDQFIFEGMEEAHRVVASGGLVWVKCMDQIMSGKQVRQHITVQLRATGILDMVDEDLFTLVQKGKPPMRHKHQLHARKNNSFLWVFRKK